MISFWKYFYMQLRRVVKRLPALMTITLAVCMCVAAFGIIYLNSDAVKAGSRKYKIAVVGDTTDTYLGFGIAAMTKLDDSRFMLEFPIMEEAEAREALRKNEITAYAVVPDDLVESIVDGKNDATVKFVTGTLQKGITGALAEKLTEVASTLIVDSENGIFSMQDILVTQGMTDVWNRATDELNLRYIDMVLHRSDLCGVEELGISRGLSTPEYYFCSMIVFFLLLAGINSSPLFGRRTPDMMKLAASRGLGAFFQTAAEYMAYLLSNLCCLLAVFLVMIPLFEGGIIKVDGWEGISAGGLAAYYLKLFPVTAAFSALQFLLYELVNGIVGSILLQFILAMAMAYISGCFYPANMFPDILKKLGEVLPTGVGMRYQSLCLSGESAIVPGLALILYMAVFIGLSVYVRSTRLKRG